MKLLDALGLKPPRSLALAGVQPGEASHRHAGGGKDSPASTVAPTAPSTPPQAGPTAPPSGAAAAGPAAAKAPASPEQAAYAAARAEVVKLRSALGAHKQAAHVIDKTHQADTALAAAGNEAAKPAWPKAMAQLAKARKACEDGQRFADGFADFLVHRGEANLVLTAAQTSGFTNLGTLQGHLASADTLAAPAARNYAGAKARCKLVVDGLAPLFKRWYVDDVRPRIAALKAKPAAKFIAAEVAVLDAELAKQQARVAARDWRGVRLGDSLVATRLLAATKMADRRAAFDTARPQADAALKKLAPHAQAVAAPAKALTERLARADAMASKAGMQFEDATREVTAVAAAAGALLTLATSAAAYTKERAALAGELSAQRGKPGADVAKPELDVVRGLIDQAAQAAGDKGAPGTLLLIDANTARHDLATAMARLAQARSTFATAKALADGLGAAAAATAGLKGSPDASQLRKSADALQKEIDAAAKAKGAALAKDEFATARKAVADGRAQIDAKDAAQATRSLTIAGQFLAAARRKQIEHGAFVARHAVLKKRLDQHNANKAQAGKIRAKIDALARHLASAEAADTVFMPAEAMKSLAAAEVAAAAADAALVARIAFDKAANTARLDLAKPAFASLKAAQGAALDKARLLADAFDFAAANKAVAAVRRAMDALEAEGMAKKNPPDPKLAAKAKKLFESGATKELDDLIQKLPDTLDAKVFIDLAQARFPGVKFQAERDGFEQASLQRMCALMKDIPADVIGNPSLKKINRRVTEVDGSGNPQDFPYYNDTGNEVVMNSRPQEFTKPDFDAGATGLLPEREEACKPANNNPEDLFDFNMLHELAHAIDDAKNFMASKEKLADFGGWISIGGDVDQIVEAVVKETGFGTTPAERKYVRDRILRNPSEAPAAFTGDKVKFETFVTAAQTVDVWDSQALTDQATLGTRVYHEGYPNVWFSYLAAARKRGITSYQFRAPGEWFSELYAAWKIGKLKPSHPAVKWLEKIKV
jgi:hypothetical protein